MIRGKCYITAYRNHPEGALEEMLRHQRWAQKENAHSKRSRHFHHYNYEKQQIRKC